MNKQRASGRKDGYARISGLADICERPHMSMERFFAKDEQKKSGMRMGGALRERQSAEQCVVYSYVFVNRRS